MPSVAVTGRAAVVIALIATTGCAVGEELSSEALGSAALREEFLAAASQSAMGGRGPVFSGPPARSPNAPPPEDSSPPATEPEPAPEQQPEPAMNEEPSPAALGGMPSTSGGGATARGGSGGSAPEMEPDPSAGGQLGLPEEPEPSPPTMPSGTQPFPMAGAGGEGPAMENLLLIDDMEDGNDQVSAIAGRDGTWFTFNDGGGTQLFEIDTACNRAPPVSVACAHSTASTFPEYAGFGLALREGDLPVDASMYEGVRFHMKNAVPGPVVVSILTASSNAASGSPGFEATIQTNSTWREFEVGFDQVALATWYMGPRVTFDAEEVVKVQYYTPSGASHDIAVDDIEFY